MHYLSVVLFAGTHEIHSPVLFDSVPRPLKLLEMWGRLESILSSISKKAHQILSYCPFPNCIRNSREICPRILHELCTILSKYDKNVLSSVPTYCGYQARVPRKPISANRGLNLANRRIHFFPRFDPVPESMINFNLGIN